MGEAVGGRGVGVTVGGIGVGVAVGGIVVGVAVGGIVVEVADGAICAILESDVSHAARRNRTEIRKNVRKNNILRVTVAPFPNIG